MVKIVYTLCFDVIFRNDLSGSEMNSMTSATVRLTAGETTPEDSVQRWRRKSEEKDLTKDHDHQARIAILCKDGCVSSLETC